MRQEVELNWRMGGRSGVRRTRQRLRGGVGCRVSGVGCKCRRRQRACVIVTYLQELPLTSEEGLTTMSNVTLSTYQKVDHADFDGKKCFRKKMYAENLMTGMVSAIVPAGTCDISAFFETKSLCSSKARGFFFCVHLLAFPRKHSSS